MAGSARQARRIKRLAAKARMAGPRITRRHRLDDPTVGNGARSSNVIRDAAVIWQCRASPGMRAKWGSRRSRRWPQCFGELWPSRFGPPREDPQASGRLPGSAPSGSKEHAFPLVFRSIQSQKRCSPEEGMVSRLQQILHRLDLFFWGHPSVGSPQVSPPVAEGGCNHC